MKKNLTLPDSYLRMGVALALMVTVLGNWVEGVWASVALVLGLVLGVTAYARFCPFYALFGINSDK